MLRTTSDFDAKGWGVYAQDLVPGSPDWKLLGGLRYDSMDGDYNSYAIPSCARPVTTTAYRQKISGMGKPLACWYQPAPASRTTSLTVPRSSETPNITAQRRSTRRLNRAATSKSAQKSTLPTNLPPPVLRCSMQPNSTKQHRPDLNIAVLSGKRHVRAKSTLPVA